MTTIGLRLEPLDVLFFRDGRPFDPAVRVSGELPTPQPLAGALRTALLANQGFNFEGFTRERRSPQNREVSVEELLRRCGASEGLMHTRFRGPWLALFSNTGKAEPLLPAPANLARDKEGWVRAAPVETPVPGWRDSLLPLWRKGRPKAKNKDAFLTPAGVGKFLAGGLPDDSDWLEPSDLYDFDNRTGIAIDANTLTSAEGQIYGIRKIVLRSHVVREGPHQGKRIGLYAEVLPPEGYVLPALAGPMPLGGEGHRVQVSQVEAVRWPESKGGGRSLWLLATPAPVAQGRSWPEQLPADRLRAAASLAPLVFSGWDVARGGPRPTRFAVRAGSVYFVEGNWVPSNGSLCVDAEDVAQGWGFVLQGVWK